MPFARRTAILTLAGAALLLPAATTTAKTPDHGARARHAVLAHVSLGPTGRFAKQAARARARAHAAQDCANADVTPNGSNGGDIRDAILCLHNQIRAQRGLPLLHVNAKLRRAADGHSQDMVSREFFDHTTPDGVTMVTRIFRARYASNRVGWSLGENLAWGTGSLSTPRGVMQAWMNSPGHRANILRRDYREIGIGVVTGIPSGDSDGATYTTDFGVIHR
jgi:uncharacterized protein YkwD